MPTNLPWELVPTTDPDVSSEVRSTASALADVQRRAFLWIAAISDALLFQASFPAYAARPAPDGFMMAAGFVPVPYGLQARHSSENFFFGACLYPEPIISGEQRFADEITVSGETFSVLIAPAHFTRHKSLTPLPHPYVQGAASPSGTAACWARPKSGVRTPISLFVDGVLTAAHVGVSLPGAVANLVPPNPHAVIGYAIDAVVLSPGTIPTDATLLPVKPAVVPGNVDVNLQSGTKSVTILQVFAPTTYIGLLTPHRMVIDTAFSPGDSGALVADQINQDAVGIYIGASQNKATGATVGVCQIMSQVVDQLALDLFL